MDDYPRLNHKTIYQTDWFTHYQSPYGVVTGKFEYCYFEDTTKKLDCGLPGKPYYLHPSLKVNKCSKGGFNITHRNRLNFCETWEDVIKKAENLFVSYS